jgi:hypothetical protein
MIMDAAARDYIINTLCILTLLLPAMQAADMLDTADETRRRAEFLERQLAWQRSYYDRVKHDAEEAYALVGEGNGETAGKILDGLTDRLSSVQYFCDNAVVNAVINEKAEDCRRCGAALDCQVALGAEEGIDEMDLCSLFANVLDNAVSSCRESGAEKPSVSLSAAVRKGYLVLRCVNTAGPAGKKGSRDPLAEHGWGLDILRDMAARYDGSLETEPADGLFSVKVFLKCGPAPEHNENA